jgi:transcriptional regulator with XRE-family HTH domain
MPKSTVRTKGTTPVKFNLRAERKKRGMTQEELAKRMGIPQATVSKLESGQIKSLNLAVVASAIRCLNEYGEPTSGKLQPGDLLTFD